MSTDPGLRAYAEWWAWAKSKNYRPIQSHLAAEAALEAAQAGAAEPDAIKAAIAATGHEERHFSSVDPHRAAYATWYSTGIDLGLDRDRAHLFADHGTAATESGMDIRSATASAEEALGLRKNNVHQVTALEHPRTAPSALLGTAFLAIFALSAASLAWVLTATPPSASARTNPTARQVAMTQQDAPAGLVRCAQSGDMQHYVSSLPPNQNGQTTVQTWNQLKTQGVIAGDIELFMDSQAACNTYLLGGSPTTRLAVNVVYQFRDAPTATKVYSSGQLTYGSLKPGTQSQPPGITQGSATGLGPNSLTYAPPGIQLYVAVWQEGRFAELYEATSIPTPTAQQAVKTLYARAA